MSNELKPCPFCNGTHSINVINFFTGDSFRKCDICGAEAPEAKTPEEAAEKWNTRPAEDALQSEIERLKAALKRIAYYRDLNLEMKATEFAVDVESELRNFYCTMGDIAKMALGTENE
ncbi:MAG: Lar family restriction alleviation protein [Lentisphaeria bacterium]|nr:Lar family restriction alleviation protein [Lentisphaeria bacterium]